MARILFIDDDSLILTMLTRAVEMYGHQSIVAETGAEAQRVATEQTPDIIFVDMLLADMSGLDVIENLRTIPRLSSIPVVMLTAGQELDAPDKARQVGATAYLQKPIQIKTLMGIIRQYTSDAHPAGQ
jgi:two-component system chemotaxis response regulator CheY